MIVKQLLKILLTTLIALILICNSPAIAADTAKGAKIFQSNCAGCHPNGSNIIRRGKNLSQKALHRYKMDSLDAIARIVTNGKNNMSAYQGRLSQPEIDNVAAYVLEQAAKGWR